MNFNTIEETVDDKNENLVFYYNREERIKRAPQNVKDYYSGRMKVGGGGFFKCLVATKTNRFVFIAIVVFVAVIFAHGFFGNRPYLKNVDGIPMELKSTQIDEQIFTSLTLGNALEKYDYSQGIEITMTIQYLDENNSVIETLPFDGSEKIIYKGEKYFFRTSYPGYDIIKKVHLDVELLNKKVELDAVVELR